MSAAEHGYEDRSVYRIKAMMSMSKRYDVPDYVLETSYDTHRQAYDAADAIVSEYNGDDDVWLHLDHMNGVIRLSSVVALIVFSRTEKVWIKDEES